MAKKFIAIAGNIGVGKSSLTCLLSQRLGWEAFYEMVNDNPYLEDFYADMNKWSFHLQIYFLSKRFKHHRQIVANPNSVIQDRTIYEDVEIFAKNLYLQGSMDERDYRNYRDLFETMAQFLQPPDLIVYLRASVPILKRRIKFRGRDFEQNIPDEYLAHLNKLYEEWTSHFELCPILTLPTDDLDFVVCNDHLELITDEILDKLGVKL